MRRKTYFPGSNCSGFTPVPPVASSELIAVDFPPVVLLPAMFEDPKSPLAMILSPNKGSGVVAGEKLKMELLLPKPEKNAFPCIGAVEKLGGFDEASVGLLEVAEKSF